MKTFLVLAGVWLLAASAAGLTMAPLNATNINCTSTNVVISIPYEALRLQKVGLDGAGFVDVKKMYMIKTADSFQPIPGCMAVKRIAKDDYYFSIDLTTKNGRECAANMTTNGQINYEFLITLDPTTFSWQVTMDMPKILFRITCVLPSNAENANAATLSTYKGKSTYKADAVDKPFDVNIAYFPSGYGQPAATTADTYSVDTTTPVRLRYELNPAYWGALVLQAKSCWVSPFADSTKNPKMHIIENWCKKDDILTSSMSGVTKNNQDKQVDFFFTGFVWTVSKSSNIYVHCDLFICSTANGEVCTKTCPSRRHRQRRSAADEAEEHTRGEGKVVSAGPFVVSEMRTETRREPLPVTWMVVVAIVDFFLVQLFIVHRKKTAEPPSKESQAY